MDTAPNNTHTQRVSILLMCIVDTVAQVATRGQWRPYFDLTDRHASLYFRPADFSQRRQHSIGPDVEVRDARITAWDEGDAQEQIEALEAMLAFARRHLEAQPGVAA